MFKFVCKKADETGDVFICCVMLNETTWRNYQAGVELDFPIAQWYAMLFIATVIIV